MRSTIIRLAKNRRDLRPHLLSVLCMDRVATEFPSQEALEQYLKDHPKANPKNHSVAQKDTKDEKEGPDSHAKHLDGAFSPAVRKIVDQMPTKAFDKDKGYRDPALKAAVKDLVKLPLSTVRGILKDLGDVKEHLSKKLVDTKDPSIAAAHNQVQQAWRAANQALDEMDDSRRSREESSHSGHLSRSDLKTRAKVPKALVDKLERWEGAGKNDPIFRVVSEAQTNEYVPHAKIDRAIEHLTDIAESPHHMNDKQDILSLRDDLSKMTRRPLKKGSLFPRLVRLAHGNPSLRPHLLPILKEAYGGTHVPVKDLPPVVHRALREVGYGRRDIEVKAATSVSIQDMGGDGYQAFAIVLNLGTGQYDIYWGSWGGPNINAPRNQVDLDERSHAIPVNGAVIKGHRGGGGPAYAKMYVHPENMGALLPVAVELSRDEDMALAILAGLKPGYRGEAFMREGIGPYSPTAPLIQSLAKKGLVKVTGSGVQITINGRNAVNPRIRVG